MRALKFFILPALLVAAPLAQADQVPVLDVQKSCRQAQDYGVSDAQRTFRNCMLDEKEAKQQLVQKWSQFKRSDRRSCIPDAPAPSYVEMLTCLEMNRENAAALQRGGRGPAALWNSAARLAFGPPASFSRSARPLRPISLAGRGAPSAYFTWENCIRGAASPCAKPFPFLYPICHMRARKSPESEQAIDRPGKISRIGGRNTLNS